LQVSSLKNFYFRNIAAIAAILGGYTLYLLPQFLNIGGIRGFCMFRSVSGIPCPGCGMGRASILLSQGEFWEAFIMNPMAIPFAVGALAAIIWLSIDLIRKKETLLPLLSQKMKWPYFLALLAVIAGVWGWNIVKDL
jgi:hypothetical protein